MVNRKKSISIFHGLVKRKNNFLQSVLYLVFSVWRSNRMIYQHIYQIKHKRQNTKHVMNSTFLRIRQLKINEKFLITFGAGDGRWDDGSAQEAVLQEMFG